MPLRPGGVKSELFLSLDEAQTRSMAPSAHVNPPLATQIIGNATAELSGITALSWLVPRVARHLFLVAFVLFLSVGPCPGSSAELCQGTTDTCW